MNSAIISLYRRGTADCVIINILSPKEGTYSMGMGVCHERTNLYIV